MGLLCYPLGGMMKEKVELFTDALYTIVALAERTNVTPVRKIARMKKVASKALGINV